MIELVKKRFGNISRVTRVISGGGKKEEMILMHDPERSLGVKELLVEAMREVD